MRRSTCFLLSLVLTGMAFGACAAPVAVVHATRPAEKVEKEFAEARKQFVGAYLKRDADELSDLFAEDARMAGTEHPFWMEGRETIRRNWARFFKAFPTAEIFFWQSDIQVNSHPVETGYFLMVMPDRTGQVQRVNGRYSITWAKIGDRWKIVNLHACQIHVAR